MLVAIVGGGGGDAAATAIVIVNQQRAPFHKMYTQFSMFDVSLAMKSYMPWLFVYERMHVLCKLNFDKND